MNNNSSVPALERGLDLLEWITTRNEPVTLTQIAQGMDRSVSEMQRTVACLLGRGYVSRSEAGTYSLSGKLYRLALANPPYLQIQRAALPAMLEFARETEQSVHISVPDGDEALLLADVPGGGLVRISLQAGARLDAEDTVSGRVLMAFDAFGSVQSRKRALVSRLKEIRQNGCEQAASSYAEGIEDIGVPVRDHAGQTVAALTVSLLRLKKSQRGTSTLLLSLRKCAERIELLL